MIYLIRKFSIAEIFMCARMTARVTRAGKGGEHSGFRGYIQGVVESRPAGNSGPAVRWRTSGRQDCLALQRNGFYDLPSSERAEKGRAGIGNTAEDLHHLSAEYLRAGRGHALAGRPERSGRV